MTDVELALLIDTLRDPQVQVILRELYSRIRRVVKITPDSNVGNITP